MATVAFLGLGIMGAPLAVNLVRAGFDVVGWNRTASKAAPVREAGGAVAKTPAEAVDGADYILSILDSGPVVREVFFDSGAIDRMKPGAIFIDMASIPPKMAQDHAARLKDRGVGHLDAPVSGGSLGAAEGSLAIMAGERKRISTAPKPRAFSSRWGAPAISGRPEVARSRSSPIRSWWQ